MIPNGEEKLEEGKVTEIKRVTLKEAVAKSRDTVQDDKTDDKKVEEKTKEPVVENKEEIVLSQEDKDAIQFVKDLKDPNKRGMLIKFMAQEEGLLGKNENLEDLTKKEKKDLKSTLLEKIPAEYREIFNFLPDLFEIAVNERTAELVARLDKDEVKRIEVSTESEIKDYYKNNEDAVNYSAQMNTLAKNMPMGPNQKVSDYLDALYKVASHGKPIEKEVKKEIKQVVDKINKNAENKPIKEAEVETSTIKIGSRLPTLRESVKLGAEGKRVSRG